SGLVSEEALAATRGARDLLYLRDLVLDGEFDTALAYLAPLEASLKDGYVAACREIMTQRLLELLFVQDAPDAAAVGAVLDALRAVSSKDEYNELCFLLTLDDLSAAPQYADWSPARGRARCFDALLDVLVLVGPDGSRLSLFSPSKSVAVRAEPPPRQRMETLLSHALQHQIARLSAASDSGLVRPRLPAYVSLLAPPQLPEAADPLASRPVLEPTISLEPPKLASARRKELTSAVAASTVCFPSGALRSMARANPRTAPGPAADNTPAQAGPPTASPAAPSGDTFAARRRLAKSMAAPTMTSLAHEVAPASPNSPNMRSASGATTPPDSAPPVPSPAPAPRPTPAPSTPTPAQVATHSDDDEGDETASDDALLSSQLMFVPLSPAKVRTDRKRSRQPAKREAARVTPSSPSSIDASSDTGRDPLHLTQAQRRRMKQLQQSLNAKDQARKERAAAAKAQRRTHSASTVRKTGAPESSAETRARPRTGSDARRQHARENERSDCDSPARARVSRSAHGRALLGKGPMAAVGTASPVSAADHPRSRREQIKEAKAEAWLAHTMDAIHSIQLANRKSIEVKQVDGGSKDHSPVRASRPPRSAVVPSPQHASSPTAHKFNAARDSLGRAPSPVRARRPHTASSARSSVDASRDAASEGPSMAASRSRESSPLPSGLASLELTGGGRSPEPVTRPIFDRVRPAYLYRDVQAIRCISFDEVSGDGLVVGTNSKKLLIGRTPRDLVAGEMPGRLDFDTTLDKYHMGSVYCVAWHGAATSQTALIASGSNSKVIKVYAPSSRATVVLRGHSGTVRDLAFAPGSTVLYSGGAGRAKVKIWDVGTGVASATLAGHTGHVYAVRGGVGSTEPEHGVVSAGLDGTVRMWDARASVPLVSTLHLSDEVYGLDVGRVGSLVGVGLASGVLELHDMRRMVAGAPLVSAPLHTDAIKSVALKGGYVLTGSYDGCVVVADTTSLRTQGCYKAHDGKVIQVAWHPRIDGVFASSSADKTARVWAPSS
ncbi:uncharacterized protein AMSG_11560, partial [Thecamonas trahens ATCC 50062]